MKENRTFILRKNSHITQTIIMFDTDSRVFPLTDKEQGIIDELEKITDLHFIFTSNSVKKLKPQVFSELYQAASYTITSDNVMISGVMHSIEYDREMFPGKHSYYFIIGGWNLENVDPGSIDKITKSVQLLSRSIFKINRYSSDVLGSFYLYNDNSFFSRFVVDRRNMYTTHTVSYEDCSVIALNNKLYSKIVEFLDGKQGYQETFCGVWEFFGSVTARLLKDDKELLLNQSIDDVKINPNGV